MTPEKPKRARIIIRSAIQIVFTSLWIFLSFYIQNSSLWLEVIKLPVFIIWSINLAGWVNDIRFNRASYDKY